MAFRRKSPDPPIPFNMRDPRAQVELACAYMSTSRGVFMAMTPEVPEVSEIPSEERRKAHPNDE